MTSVHSVVLLGSLEKVHIRDAWPNEERNFTCWLAAEGWALLANELNINLRILQREHPVGKYSLDILAAEVSDNDDETTEQDRLVIIENQYGSTDHDHLGKLLTYAAGVGKEGQGAKTILWIAENFTEEHQRTLEWLNKISHAGVRFYGVQVELYKIGDSAPAPAFNLVVRPNEIARARRETSVSSSESERGLFYIEYWTAFQKLCIDKGALFNLQTPRPDYFAQATLGKTGVHLAFTAGKRDKYLGCEITFRNPALTEILPRLEQHREAIEAELGVRATWDSSNKLGKISIRKPADPSNREAWSNQHDWLFDNGQKFFATFSKHLKLI